MYFRASLSVVCLKFICLRSAEAKKTNVFRALRLLIHYVTSHVSCVSPIAHLHVHLETLVFDFFLAVTLSARLFNSEQPLLSDESDIQFRRSVARCCARAMTARLERRRENGGNKENFDEDIHRDAALSIAGQPDTCSGRRSRR
jgi:hypothetical protein